MGVEIWASDMLSQRNELNDESTNHRIGMKGMEKCLL